MKLKVPPVFQLIFFGLIMWFIQQFTARSDFDFLYRNVLVWFFVLLGILFGISGIYSFRKANTSIDPLRPEKASKLVTGGLYGISRNPMYLGLLFLLIALFFYLRNIFNIPILIGYIWYITEFQIKPEESVLKTHFGEQYREYRAKVRRWL